jgi:hypothetical protein
MEERETKMNEQTMEMDELEFEQPLEEEIERVELTANGRKIFTDKGDPEIDSLHRKWTKGKLILQPEFQRHFVWDTGKSKRFGVRLEKLRFECFP